MQHFVNRGAFPPFFDEPAKSEIMGYHPGNFSKLSASQSPSKNWRRRRWKKMRRVDESVEEFLASVVNASTRQRRGLRQRLKNLHFAQLHRNSLEIYLQNMQSSHNSRQHNVMYIQEIKSKI